MNDHKNTHRILLISVALLALLPLSLAAQTPAPSTDQPADGTPQSSPSSKPVENSHPHSDASVPAPITPPKTPSETSVAPGLSLPDHGSFWALDTFQGKPDLVHLRYSYVTFNRHYGSNFLKAQVAPFIAKLKGTIELKGSTAAIRLHTATPVIYMRGKFQDESSEAADSGSAPTASHLALLRLKTKKDKRISSSIDFTQITGTAHRSQTTVPIRIEPVGETGWQRITPLEPLKPGEYALMPVFQGQDIFSTTAFDFAVDSAAPQNSEVISPNAPPAP